MAGKIIETGRWRSIMLANLLLCIGSGLKFAPKFSIFAVGWFLHGFSAGLFSVLTPKYISEVAPVKISGTFGAFSQLTLCFGTFLASLFNPLESQIDETTFLQIVYLTPCVFALI